MKKIWLKTMASIIIISILLSVNVYAETLEKIDVVLNSGDVVEEEQYYVGRSEESDPNFDPNFKDVNKVTFNAFGPEPIIVKAFGFAGWSAPVSVNEIVFNGTGDIILGSNAFAVTNITDLNLPSNIKFEDGANEVFYKSKVKNVTIGCSMCESMFYGCGFLETVTFTADNDISEIPKSAFEITRIEKVEIPSSVKKIEDSAFSSSSLSEIKFNEGLETIGNSAFDTWGGFKKITLPSTVKSIGDKCFNSCKPYDIELNDGLKRVGKQAFICEFANQSVKIPASVTEIGEYAFGYTFWKEKAENFTIYGYRGTAAETYANENGFTFIPLDSTDPNGIDVVLNSGDVVEDGQYSVDAWDYDGDMIDTVTFNAYGKEPITVGVGGFSSDFQEPKYVKKIIFNGDGSIVLNSMAFEGADITSLNIPSNVVFPEGAYSVFDGCGYLEKVYIGSDLCNNMFDWCGSLNEVTFAENSSITKIPRFAFSNTGTLNIVLPSSVKSIEEGAFLLSRVESIKFNEGLEAIGNRSFEATYYLHEVDFPSTLKIIGEGCFSNSLVSNVKINNGLESIGKRAFEACRYLKSVTIPASVTSIGEYAFGYESQGRNGREKYDDFTIYGYRGTAAETYANENGFTFIPLDSESSVKGVTYNPSWSSVNDYSFTVNDRADKVQVIEATGATRTFARNNSNVVIKGYDAEGNEVSSLSRELDHEVWTIRTRLTPNSGLQVHAKYKNEWESLTYSFSVSTLSSDKTLKSAELSSTSGNPDSVECKIVTGSGVNKVRIEYDDGMTTTVASSMAVLDEANMTYTYNLSVKPRHSGENNFKIYIKNPTDGWTYATTLTYTAK